MNNKNYLYIKKTVDLIVKNYQNLVLMREPMKIQFISTRFQQFANLFCPSCVRQSLWSERNVHTMVKTERSEKDYKTTIKKGKS